MLESRGRIAFWVIEIHYDIGGSGTDMRLERTNQSLEGLVSHFKDL